MYEDKQFENLTEQQVDAIVVQSGNQVIVQDGTNVAGTATAQSVLEENVFSTGTLQQSAGEATSSSRVDLSKAGSIGKTQAPTTENTLEATAKHSKMPSSQAQVRSKQTILPKKAATKISNPWSQIAPPKSQAQIRPKQTILPRRPSLTSSATPTVPLKIDAKPEAQIRPKGTFLPLKSAFPAPSATVTNTATGATKSVQLPPQIAPVVHMKTLGTKKEETLAGKSPQAAVSLANKKATPLVISKPSNPAVITEPIDNKETTAVVVENLREAIDVTTESTGKIVEMGVKTAVREPPSKNKSKSSISASTGAATITSSLKDLQSVGDADTSTKLGTEKDDKKSAEEQTAKVVSAATSPTTTTINTTSTPSPSSATGKRLDSPSSQCRENSKKQRTSHEPSPSNPGVTTGADGTGLVLSLPPNMVAARESSQTMNAVEVSVNTKMPHNTVDGKIWKVGVKDGDAVKKSPVSAALPAAPFAQRKQQIAQSETTPNDTPLPSSNGTSTKAIAPAVAAFPPGKTSDRQKIITPKESSAAITEETSSKMPAAAPERNSLRKNATPVSESSAENKVVSSATFRDTLSNIVNQGVLPAASMTTLASAIAKDVDNEKPKISDAGEESTGAVLSPDSKIKANTATEMDVENNTPDDGGKYAEVVSPCDAKPISTEEILVANDKPGSHDAGERSTETVSVPVEVHCAAIIASKADNKKAAITSSNPAIGNQGSAELKIMNVVEDASDIHSSEKEADTSTAVSTAVDKDQTPATLAPITDSSSVARSAVASENQQEPDACKTSANRSGKPIESNTIDKPGPRASWRLESTKKHFPAEQLAEVCETKKTEAEVLTPRAQNVVQNAVLPASIDIPGLAALESKRDIATTKSLLKEKIEPQEKSKIKQDDATDSSKISKIVCGVEGPGLQQLAQVVDSAKAASDTVHEKITKKREEKQTDDDVNSTISRESSEPSLVSLVAMSSSPERKAKQAGASGAEVLATAFSQAAGKCLDPAKNQSQGQTKVNGESAVTSPVKADASNEKDTLLSTEEKAGATLESITQPKPAENGVGDTSSSLKSISVLEKGKTPATEDQSIESQKPTIQQGTKVNADSIAASGENCTPTSKEKRKKKRPSPKAGFDKSSGRKSRRIAPGKDGQDAPAATSALTVTPTKAREKRTGENGQAASMNSESEKEGTTSAGESRDNMADLMVLAATMVEMQSGALSGKPKAPPKESQGVVPGKAKATVDESDGCAGAEANTAKAHVFYLQQPEDGIVCPECGVRVEDLTEFPVDWTRPLHYPEDADTIEIINDHAARHHADEPLWNTLEATICKQLASAPPKSVITPKAYVRLALRHAMCCSYGIDESLLDMNKLRDLFVRRFGIARGFIEWSSDYFIQGRTLTNNIGEKVTSTELRKAGLLLLAFLEREVIEQAFDKKLHLTETLSRTLPLQTWRNRVQLVFLDPNGMDKSWFMKE